MKKFVVLFVMFVAVGLSVVAGNVDVSSKKADIKAESSYKYVGTVSNCISGFLNNGEITPLGDGNGNIIQETYHLWINRENGRYYISYSYWDESRIKMEIVRWLVNPNPYYGQSSIFGKYRYWVQASPCIFIPHL